MTFNEWLDENENFSTRRERLESDVGRHWRSGGLSTEDSMRQMVMSWVEAAYKVGLAAGKNIKEQNIPDQPLPFIQQRPPYTYNPPPLTTDNVKPQCRKCGMRLDQVMGYVCGDTHCPTFMKVTC